MRANRWLILAVWARDGQRLAHDLAVVIQKRNVAAQNASGRESPVRNCLVARADRFALVVPTARPIARSTSPVEGEPFRWQATSEPRQETRGSSRDTDGGRAPGRNSRRIQE